MVVVAAGLASSTPGGLPAMSSLATVVAAVELTGSTPRGPAIDVSSSYGGGRYRTHRQYRQGAHHRCLVWLWWWLLPDPPTALPRGPTVDVLQQMVAIASIYCQHLLGGQCGKHCRYGARYKQDISQQKKFGSMRC
jgi:hypothetical protein